MKVKVSEASGVVLDYLVARCKGKGIEFSRPLDPWITVNDVIDQPLHSYTPSTDWAQGGPIIEQLRSYSAYQLLIESDGENVHVLSWPSKHVHFSGYGPTTLIAAMRCYATSRLGEEVEVPDELLKT